MDMYAINLINLDHERIDHTTDDHISDMQYHISERSCIPFNLPYSPSNPSAHCKSVIGGTMKYVVVLASRVKYSHFGLNGENKAVAVSDPSTLAMCPAR